MRVEFYEDKAGKHRWRVIAANEEIVGASSQGFSDPRDATLNLEMLTGRTSEECGCLIGAVDSWDVAVLM